MNELNQLTRIIEGALFAAEKPLSIDRLMSLFDEQDVPSKEMVKQALKQIQEDYAERGVELKELATGFQFQVKPDLAKWIQRLWEERAPRYSRALLETLALIAYRQPITRGEVEDIRGVAVNTAITKTLLEREWIRVVGYRDVPGKPALLATTKEFLDYFGLKSLEDLPPLSDIQDLEKLGQHLAEAAGQGAPEGMMQPSLLETRENEAHEEEKEISSAAEDFANAVQQQMSEVAHESESVMELAHEEESIIVESDETNA